MEKNDTPSPTHNVVAWKPVEYDHEVTLQASREASSNVDDADPRRVLLAVLGCAETWTPTARIIGNVRAGDISIALRAALATTTEDQLRTLYSLKNRVEEENARLKAAMQEACDLLAERIHGNAARSPGHNARVVLEWAMKEGQTPAPVSREAD